MSDLKIPLGQQEYLIQTASKELFYYKIAFNASRMQMTMPSDHLGTTAGGIRYSGVSFEIIKKIPLAQYENSVAQKAMQERWMTNASGRITESSVIFDAILFVVTRGGSSTIAKAFSTLNLIGNITSATSTSESFKGELQDKLVNMLFEMLVRKVACLNLEWIVELLTQGTSKVIGQLASDKTRKPTPSEMLLQKIQSFHASVNSQTFYLKYSQFKLQQPVRKY